MTTILVILYCVVAFLVDHDTMKAWKDEKLLGTAPQEILDNEFIFRCGILLGSLFWPITIIFVIVNLWRKK